MAKTKHPKPKPSRRIIGLLAHYDGCHEQYALRGSKMPEEWEEIDTDYEAARDGLLDYVASLEAKVEELQERRHGYCSRCEKVVVAVPDHVLEHGVMLACPCGFQLLDDYHD